MRKALFVIVFLFIPLLLAAQEIKTDTLRRDLPIALPTVPEPSMQQELELRMAEDKPWLSTNDSMPSVFSKGEVLPASNERRYTLHPYNTTTPYNWDPVYQRPIAIHSDTWRGAYWRMLRTSDVKGMTTSGSIKRQEENEPLVRFENGKLVGDYATLLTQYFTREFWRFQHKRNQKKTKEVLQEYDKVEGMPSK